MPAQRPRPCPVVTAGGVPCDRPASPSLTIALLPAGGPGRNRWISSCSWHAREVAAGASVRVEIEPDDHGRRRPRVVLVGA